MFGWFVVNKNKRGKVLGSAIRENLYIPTANCRPTNGITYITYTKHPSGYDGVQSMLLWYLTELLTCVDGIND